ncbi:hypothetical protein JOD54_002442 [Actinokineospora baliensis]|nr:hypothetical protein [Actinokineospora baliensis]
MNKWKTDLDYGPIVNTLPQKGWNVRFDQRFHTAAV